MQRSVTLKIIRPEDETISWEELGYLLRGLSFKVCRMCNFCMTHQLLHALKLETELLNPQGNLYCYPRLAEEYPDVPTGIICAAETRARKLFRRSAEAVLHSETSLPRFRKDSSIPVPVAGYQILQDMAVGSLRVPVAAVSGNSRVIVACDGEHWVDSIQAAAEERCNQAILERLGWQFIRVRGSEWYLDPEAALEKIIGNLESLGIAPQADEAIAADSQAARTELLTYVRGAAEKIRAKWHAPAGEEAI